jgi:hypothetical protein
MAGPEKMQVIDVPEKGKARLQRDSLQIFIFNFSKKSREYL